MCWLCLEALLGESPWLDCTSSTELDFETLNFASECMHGSRFSRVPLSCGALLQCSSVVGVSCMAASSTPCYDCFDAHIVTVRSTATN